METELFVHFAEIAGVFVGFGALISLRSARPTDLHDVVYIRAVLGLGVWVVICALVPIALSLYGLHERALWPPCAAGALTLWGTLVVTLNRTQASRTIDKVPERLDRVFPYIGMPLHLVIAGSLILILFGFWPGVDQALYVTALAAGVIFAGYTLLMCAMSRTDEPAEAR